MKGRRRANLQIAKCLLKQGAGFLLIVLMGCQSPSEEAAIVADVEQPAETAAETAALPPPPPTNSYLAHLSPEVTNQLVGLNINIAIPTYLPQAMTLASYEAGETAAGSAYYWLVYRNPQDQCFAIEYTASDSDDIFLENQEVLKSELFGDDYRLYHGKFPNGGEGELPESDLFTDWLEGEDGFYRLIGAGLVNAQNNGQDNCSNIPIKEALAVVESLSYLPTDIKTLERSSPAAEE